MMMNFWGMSLGMGLIGPLILIALVLAVAALARYLASPRA